jgi:uncharacterized protein (TIGR02598 family)
MTGMKREKMKASDNLIRIGRQGFSLVEVVMSVAIAALGIITVLGLIPGSLASMREAGDITARTRIIASISSEIQSSNWGQLNGDTWSGMTTLSQDNWYFDDQANPLKKGSSDLDMRQVYVARIRQSNRRVQISGQAAPNPDLLNLMVDIAVNPDPNFGFSNPETYGSWPIIVARRSSN